MPNHDGAHLLAGEACGHAKLTASQVREIRRLAAMGCKQQAIARQYGIAQSNVSQIVNRTTWWCVE
jgi:transcriptional regulator